MPIEDYPRGKPEGDNVPPYTQATKHIGAVKKEFGERIEYHMGQATKLHKLATDHEYAAAQYRIVVDAVESVPGDMDMEPIVIRHDSGR